MTDIVLIAVAALAIYNTISIIYLRIAINRGTAYPSTVRSRMMSQARKRRERGR